MDQSLKQESVRMRSTIQSLISLTRMIPTMPTTVIRSMNLKKAKHRNHLQQCLRLCNRQCNRPNSFPKKYDTAFISDLHFFLPHLLWVANTMLYSVFNRCSLRWFKRRLSPKNHLLSLSLLQIHHLYQHLTWTLSSLLPSLLLEMAASFSLSSCRKNRGTTSLTFCAHSTVFSTISLSLLSSTRRWL